MCAVGVNIEVVQVYKRLCASVVHVYIQLKQEMQAYKWCKHTRNTSDTMCASCAMFASGEMFASGDILACGVLCACGYMLSSDAILTVHMCVPVVKCLPVVRCVVVVYCVPEVQCVPVVKMLQASYPSLASVSCYLPILPPSLPLPPRGPLFKYFPPEKITKKNLSVKFLLVEIFYRFPQLGKYLHTH